MADAAQCDSCGILFKPKKGHVTLRYEIRDADRYYYGYSSDDTKDYFDLCPKCSATFLKFIDHEDERKEERERKRDGSATLREGN